MYPHTLLPYDMRSHNILWNTTKCHDAPFSADALEKRFFPGGRLKAGIIGKTRCDGVQNQMRLLEG